MRRFLIAFSFFVISVCLNQHIKAGDLFSGEWRMFVTSTGAEVPERDASIMLNIVKSGNFYNVQIKVPQAPQTAKKNRGGGYWDQFLQASQDQQTQFAIQLIREQYTGKYMLGDDGKTIEHLNGSVSFRYRKEGEMLYSKDLGCFKKQGGETSEPSLVAGNSKDEATKLNLQKIRSAIEKFRFNYDGAYPDNLRYSLFTPYLRNIPAEMITGSSNVVGSFDGSGGWCYLGDLQDSGFGKIFPNLKGKDSAGVEYKDY